MLDQVASALARMTVNAHEAERPDLAERFGPGWRGRWSADVQIRLRHIAQALAVDCPDVFVHHLAWTRQANAARHVTDDDLRTSLHCLRRVLLDELPETVATPCTAIVDAGLAAFDTPAHEPFSYIDASSTHGGLALEFLEAILDGRPRDAENRVVAAAHDGVPIPELYIDVLRPVMAEVGRLWHLGESGVGDEHLATNTVERVMAVLRTMFNPATERNRTVIAASISGDLHAVGVRMVCDFFEMDGWTAICLGANMPAADIVETLRGRRTDLLALSSTSLLCLRDVADAIDLIRLSLGEAAPPVIVGGAAFNLVEDLWSRIGADGGASTATAAVALGNQLAEASSTRA